MPHIVVREPGHVPLSLPLGDALTIGRHEDNDLMVVYQAVSRRHARLERGPGGWLVRDLGSAHGTFVNGVRTAEAPLADGDHVRVGPVQLTFADRPAGELVHAQDAPTAAPDEGCADPRLSLLFQVTRAVGAIDDPDALLGRLLDTAVRVLGCERVMAAMREQDGRDAFRRIVRACPGVALEIEIAVGRAAVDALLSRRQSVILQDHGEPAAPAGERRSGSAMGAPLTAGDRVFGFLYAEDSRRARRFGAEDLDFLSALACLTAAALDGAERCRRAAAEAAHAGGTYPMEELLGRSPGITRVKAQVRKYAAATSNVLLRGESGTGKELVARALHAASPRAAGPFIAVNCAAIPDTMIEGELFGYEKGAFTGALRARKGRFAMAHKGTLLLDEIGDLSLAAQAKVLRALQGGEILPLGAERPIFADVRAVAATHKDLRKEISEGRFREDLYYRLKVLEIEVPPLRERGDDVTLLAEAFLQAASLNLGKRLRGFSAAAASALLSYPWPGNVRELHNEIERAAVHADGPAVEITDLDPAVARAAETGSPRSPAAGSLRERYAALDTQERALVEEALAEARGNWAEAARLLGITRVMFKGRVERFGLKGRQV